MTTAEFTPDKPGLWRYDLNAGTATHVESGEEVPLVYGDCGMDVVDLPAHHGVEWPPMVPGDRCER